MNPEPLLLTVNEIASLLRVSIHTIYYWVNRSEIPHIKVGKHLRFERDKVLAFFQENTKLQACLTMTGPLKSSSPNWSLKTKHADLAYSQKE